MLKEGMPDVSSILVSRRIFGVVCCHGSVTIHDRCGVVDTTAVDTNSAPLTAISLQTVARRLSKGTKTKQDCLTTNLLSKCRLET